MIALAKQTQILIVTDVSEIWNIPLGSNLVY